MGDGGRMQELQSKASREMEIEEELGEEMEWEKNEEEKDNRSQWGISAGAKLQGEAMGEKKKRIERNGREEMGREEEP